MPLGVAQNVFSPCALSQNAPSESSIPCQKLVRTAKYAWGIRILCLNLEVVVSASRAGQTYVLC